jgi:heme exporter protein A
MQTAPFNPPPRLTAEGLVLERNGRALVDGLDVTLGPGDGLVAAGANGAGKTTLLRALAGLLRPASGRVRVEPEAGALAFLGHADGLKPSETPRQALRFWARLDGRPPEDADAALDAVGALAFSDRETLRLSAGQKRRAALARVVLSDRPIWLLDEPAAPLDAAGRARLAELAAAPRARGGVVVAATHVGLDWPDAIRLSFDGAEIPA